jgi:hypothetical protein
VDCVLGFVSRGELKGGGGDDDDDDDGFLSSVSIRLEESVAVPPEVVIQVAVVEAVLEQVATEAHHHRELQLLAARVRLLISRAHLLHMEWVAQVVFRMQAPVRTALTVVPIQVTVAEVPVFTPALFAMAALVDQAL